MEHKDWLLANKLNEIVQKRIKDAPKNIGLELLQCVKENESPVEAGVMQKIADKKTGKRKFEKATKEMLLKALNNIDGLVNSGRIDFDDKHRIMGIQINILELDLFGEVK